MTHKEKEQYMRILAKSVHIFKEGDLFGHFGIKKETLFEPKEYTPFVAPLLTPRFRSYKPTCNSCMWFDQKFKHKSLCRLCSQNYKNTTSNNPDKFITSDLYREKGKITIDRT